MVKKIPLQGFSFKSNSFQFLWVSKKVNNVTKTITKANGPFVNIAIAKKNQGAIQIWPSSLESFLQKERRHAPKVAHKSESLTAVLLQIIINGDSAKLNDEISESFSLSFESLVVQNTVSAIINIKNNVDKAEGSLADSEPNSSQISLAGIE